MYASHSSWGRNFGFSPTEHSAGNPGTRIEVRWWSRGRLPQHLVSPSGYLARLCLHLPLCKGTPGAFNCYCASTNVIISLIKTMASFLDCPTELIDSILEQVSLSDLLAVSLASKKLRGSATLLLYSHIDFRIYRDNIRALLHLSRSIFNKPELGTYIKSVRLRDGEPKIQDLHMESWRHQDKTPKASPSQPTDEDGMPLFVAFVAKSGLPYANLWIEKLRAGDLNATVALLLSKLPNLAHLRVGYDTLRRRHSKGFHQKLWARTSFWVKSFNLPFSTHHQITEFHDFDTSKKSPFLDQWTLTLDEIQTFAIPRI
jgi:hypothetical protein